MEKGNEYQYLENLYLIGECSGAGQTIKTENKQHIHISYHF